MVFVNLIWIDWTHVLWSHGTLSSPFSTEETWTTLLLLLFQIFHRNQGRAQWLAGYVGLVGFNKGRVAQPAQARLLLCLVWQKADILPYSGEWLDSTQRGTHNTDNAQCAEERRPGAGRPLPGHCSSPAARPGLSRHLCIVRLWSPQPN